MDASARGPVKYPLDELTPDQFESLVFLLARTTDPRVVPVRAKDRGLDARLPDPHGRTLHGWQAKRFTDGIHWAQCRESITRAIAFWRPPRITFCFAHDLSAAEQESFRTELSIRFRQVRLDFWPASELQRLIRDTDEGQKAAAWLFKNREATTEAMLRATAVGGPLQSTRQAAERQAVIQDFMDRDPHLRYTMVSRSHGSPETPPAPQTFISITLLTGAQEIRIDGTERYPGAIQDLGGGPQLAFSDDEDGQRAREAIERLLAQGGTEKLGSGLGTVMPAIPVGLQGLMPETGLWGAVEVQAESAAHEQPPHMPPVLVSAGDAQVGVTLAPVDTADGWDVTLGGGVGGLEIFQSSRIADGTVKSQLDWRYTRGVGSGLDQLLACQVMLAALQTEKVDLRWPEGGIAVQAAMHPPGDSEEWQEELDSLRTFLGYVAELEAWLGHDLHPPAHPSAEDTQILGDIIPRIREHEAPLTWQRIELDPGAVEPAEDGPFQFALMRPLSARIFGSEVYLGIELLHFPEGCLERDGETLAIVPIGEAGAGTARLYHPDEAPADAAEPPITP
jgi:hypothetical protein